jgi:hypothetical protein
MTESPRHRQPFPDGAPTSLTVIAWPNPAMDAQGHKPGSPYVEAVWLGVLGPATILCWSRLARIATARPETVIDTTDLATSLGLSANLGRNAPLTRTLNRMAMFGTAQHHDATIAVRRALPDVPPGLRTRLSYTARVAHQRWSQISTPDLGLSAPAVGSPSIGVTT